MEPVPVVMLSVSDGADLTCPPLIPTGAVVVVRAASAAMGAAAADVVGSQCRGIFVGDSSIAGREFVADQFAGAPTTELVWP